ncbi:hypothetical protein JB92DRAFT_3102846 [Gautieria morchelliformis]|nr:hypothetical protein JB92DRAFT_3102846 [Gautieria morchelliformis]
MSNYADIAPVVPPAPSTSAATADGARKSQRKVNRPMFLRKPHQLSQYTAPALALLMLKLDLALTLKLSLSQYVPSATLTLPIYRFRSRTCLYRPSALVSSMMLIERKRQKSAPRLLIISNLGTENLDYPLLPAPTFWIEEDDDDLPELPTDCLRVVVCAGDEICGDALRMTDIYPPDVFCVMTDLLDDSDSIGTTLVCEGRPPPLNLLTLLDPPLMAPVSAIRVMLLEGQTNALALGVQNRIGQDVKTLLAQVSSFAGHIRQILLGTLFEDDVPSFNACRWLEGPATGEEDPMCLQAAPRSSRAEFSLTGFELKDIHIGILHRSHVIHIKIVVVAVACKENVARVLIKRLDLPLQASRQKAWIS